MSLEALLTPATSIPNNQTQPVITDQQQQPQTSPPIPATTDASVTATTPKSEEAVKVEAPKETDKLAQRFAAIAREERRLQKEKQEVKERFKRVEEFEKKKELARQNPLSALDVLSELGTDYNKLTDAVITGGKRSAEQEAKEAMQEVHRLREELAQKEASQAEEYYSGVVQGFKAEISEHLKANLEKYEFTANHPESEDLVYNAIDQYHQKTGKLLTLDEAASAIEKTLEEDFEQKIMKLKKVSSRFAKEEAPKETPKVNPTSAPSLVRTLTNSQQTNVPAPQSRPWSPENSLAQAAALLKWK